MPNAPGKAFRKGISLIDLFSMFPDNQSAEQWLETQRWGKPGQPSSCPICGSCQNLKSVKSKKPLPYRCGECRSYFSVKTGTVMHRSKISTQKWVIAIYLWATSLKGVSSMKLHRDLNITQKSAYFMAMRLREAWTQSGGKMRGPIEVDETYFGGTRKNMSNKKRKQLKNKGRGTVGKTAVVGAKYRSKNKVQAQVVEATDKATLQKFVADKSMCGSTVYTDEAAAYKGVPNVQHESVNHSTKEFVRGKVHTNGIESFWAGLKRAHKGTFHKISPKHLQRYVDEFATRHNLRELDTMTIMQETAARMDGKRLTYKCLIADNGLPNGAKS